MNKGVPPPPNYNDVMNNNGSVTMAEVRGSWPGDGGFGQHQALYKDPGIHRSSDSRSSCSSGSGSIRLVGNNTAAFLPDNYGKDLPPAWEVRYLPSGRVYYSHLPTDTHHWNHPLEKTDLPPGWERVYSPEFGEYYINHVTKSAQFNHPGSLPSPVTGEQHAQALAAVRLRKMRQNKSHSSTYVPPSQYMCEEIPKWLEEYANTPDEKYDWASESYQNLDKYQTLMTRLYRQELRQCIEQYEDYRNHIIKELEDRMQLHDLNPAQLPTTTHHDPVNANETFV